ncbi:MAG: hypothetical protein NT023_00850 [Armatimonadetes bacterium]|nr:hypothetical protein [Armatimonadota bacterium]
MPIIEEGDLKFDFPNDWQASKLDDWSFYRNQFAKLAKAEIVCKNCAKKITAGVKSMDVMAIKEGLWGS